MDSEMVRASPAWSAMPFPEMVVYTGGRVPAIERERFAGAVGRLLERLDVPGDIRLRITAPERGPLVIQVNLRIGDIATRIQTRTRRDGDALSTVVRLERQITALRGTRQPRPWPDPTRRPLDTPGRGELVRRKPVPARHGRPAAAAAVMDAMDYDTHLFIDAETGEDAIVYRAGPSGLRLARCHSVHPPLPVPGGPWPFTVNPRPAPLLTEADAVARLCEHGLPFLFYTDPGTGRGRLLYRRYDSHLALVLPDDGTEVLPS
ncbi:sigma 54 modulation/S30EA ribosomal C-terminal domain-containing protein [Nocardia rhamnosiphila]|uniref:sigma 54 modulation/S30EA ribosomal C-terminal domain-containing protein n=1 Tax=Nocardia rhamnosiphila TaxID=426716 RepID=UPI0037A9B8FA